MGAEWGSAGSKMDGRTAAPYAGERTRRAGFKWCCGCEETRGHDVTDRGRRGLRSAPGRPPSDQPVALHERLLARPGHHARHDRPGVAVLSHEFADLVAAGLAARQGQAGLESRGYAGAGARSVRHGFRHLQSAVRRADGVFRGYGGRVLPGAERLAGEGMARQRRAIARLDRDPRAERREIRRGDRALRRGPAFRAGADAGHGRHAARQARLLADLCRRRAAQIADRHSRRLQLSQPTDLGRLGLLSHRGLRRPGAGVPDAIDEPDRRRRVRAASEPENGDAGIGLHLAAAVPVAAAQVLARHPDGNAVGGSGADGDRAQQYPLLPAAGRCAAGSASPELAVRPYAVG